MAALRGSAPLSRFISRSSFLQRRGISSTHCLTAAWNKDWLPAGKVPQTEEEIKKAAEKYDIPPEYYRPFKDPIGDYPDPGIMSQEKREPNYNWDDYIDRRNYGEFVEYRFKNNTEDRNDPLHYTNSKFSPTFQLFFYLLVVSGFATIWTYAEKYPVNLYFEEQMPFNNKKKDFVSPHRHDLIGNYDRVIHYTFEPAE